ncbi:MAG: hypothetical protein ACX933_18285, partial [Marinobacter adhaerens]
MGNKSNLRTVSAAVAYDDPKTREAIMLVIHQAIEIPTIRHNLLCPMQMRMNDVRVNDEPKHMVANPTASTHAITIPLTEKGDGDDGQYVIPLLLRGPHSYFPSRKPTLEEYEQAETVLD